LEQIDREAPRKSPLVEFAFQPHGGSSQPPLGRRNAVAADALVAWCRSLEPAAGRPEPISIDADASSPSRSLSASYRRDVSGAEPGDDPAATAGRGVDALGASFGERDAPAATGDQSVGQIKRLPEVHNPFDPEIFNRGYHTVADLPKPDRPGTPDRQ
jgi:hypothetical protein